jgi:glucose/arabinose dehydrogenase
MKQYLYLIVLFLTIFVNCSASGNPAHLEKLKVPSGYSIKVYADQLPGARTMAISDSGVIFVGTRGQGKIYALVPPKNTQEKMRTITLLSNLNNPNGVAYYKGDLYVAEIDRILKYENVDKHLDDMPDPIVLNKALPSNKWHGPRVIKVGPDERIYVSIGMPCNTCNFRDEQPLFGTISNMSLDGKDLKPYAIGIRNSVGFDWHPETSELWFTDNGQDLLGADIPPEEVNRAEKSGLDFGFPYVYGDNILYPDYDSNSINKLSFTVPLWKIQAHSAPLGMIFYRPNQILVALHGSWNRNEKVGYEVIQLKLEGNKVVSAQPFITGWLQGNNAWGRPVDFLILPDKSLLITDDFNGLIYRVSADS